MRTWGRFLLYAAQSAIVGLAIAFVVLLVKPELVNLPPRDGGLRQGFADAVAASAPAVVTINTEGFANGSRGLGSGILVDNGYLLTSYHVISGARQVEVQLADGRIAYPRLIGADPETEVALLKLDLPDLPSIRLGRSNELRPGDIVLAIGNSLGLSQTVTMGIVSATGRDQLNVVAFNNFIQTDAAINLGSSGGALVNARGELIGINTAVATMNGSQGAAPAGIGFAIPVNLVRGVMAEILENGRVIRGWLGVEDSRVLVPQEYRVLGLERPAIELQEVRGPALEAGLAPGDIVTHVDGQRVVDALRAARITAMKKPGERVLVRAFRSGEGIFEVDVVLAERPLPP